MNPDIENGVVIATKRSLEAWKREAGFVDPELSEAMAALQAAVSAYELALDTPGVIAVHKGCGGTIGYDAWVDSNEEVCGGPFDFHVCMKCGEEEPNEIVPGELDD
jgi:hypothetical protein